MVKNIIFVNRILKAKLIEMKINYIVIFLFFSSLFSQVSLSDIKDLSNQQLDLIKEELSKQNSVEDTKEMELKTVKVASTVETDTNNLFFGYEYFKKGINFFDNTPVPRDFILGPGDEVIISVWGETNFRQSFTLNREGMIYYEKIGFLNLSNKTVSEAKQYIKNEFSKIISTLKENEKKSDLLLEVGQLKSINVYFTGNVSIPGIHLIHPFSDVFSAIVQAGGINQNGSLRNIKVFRKNKEIISVDFYSFFLEGANNFADLRLIDGDIIHVPNVLNRAEIKGEVVRKGFFELFESETVSDLINYAGGYTENSSQSAVLNLIIPTSKRSSDDNALTSLNLNAESYHSFKLNNGDSINILSISDVESKVEVFGRVKNPGLYSFNSKLKEVLDLAGGFNDPIYRESIDLNKIVVLRKDSSDFYAKDFLLNYESSKDFQLKPEDKIFVYENTNYRNIDTFRIEGEVISPGTYPLKKGFTLKDAIAIAGGLTIASNNDNIVVFKEILSYDENNQKEFILEAVSGTSLDFELGKNSVIKALSIENTIDVRGNVYNPGFVSYKKGITVKDAIRNAGGFMPNTLKNEIFIRKINGETKLARTILGREKKLSPGDKVFVPLDPNPEEFDVTAFVADLATVLANIAAILLIVDNQTN